MVAGTDVWAVVGGCEKGGIIVRVDRDTTSAEAAARLTTGSLVRALEHDGQCSRLKYQLLSGDGPETGWISTQVRGKELLSKLDSRLEEDLGLLSIQKKVPAIFSQGDISAEEDSDSEDLPLCTVCRLPLGERGYSANGGGQRLLHGECMAQRLVHRAREQETVRRREEALEKDRYRRDFGIGWCEDALPSDAPVAAALGLALPGVENNGAVRCRLVLDAAARQVTVAAATDPSAAVSLEYLAVALAVRRREGREPRFSLDPVGAAPDSSDDEALTQMKRFEPAWLAGTSVGEVMFQADFYLKELSMGEYKQPVAGMKSCFELAEKEGSEARWSAREWFYVRKAEVQRSEDGSLVPRISMGVEAREQLRAADGVLEDAPLTRADHPLVLYAEEFTRNFDLIAERRSVVFHLRELAKASVLAKFLGEAEIALPDAWFGYTPEVRFPLQLEVPQLWNRHCLTEVRVKDGELLDAARGIGSRVHGVYGGVEFGLARFNLSAVAQGRAPVDPGTFQTTRVWNSEQLPPLEKLPRFPQARIPRRPRRPPGMELRGVDLSLEDFELTSARDAARPAQAGSWGGCLAACESPWDILDGSHQPSLDVEDMVLLRDIYGSTLADRRLEGGRCPLPDSSFDYVHKLRGLVKKEEVALRQHEDDFLSAAFSTQAGGSLSSSRRGAETTPLFPRPELLDSPVLGPLLHGVAPILEKVAEDGAKLRVYRLGVLEVRTIADADGPETVGAVFSAASPASELPTGHVPAEERIVKVIEYVERAPRSAASDMTANRSSRRFHRKYFVLFETASGSAVLTERLPDGRTAWVEQPPDLPVRRALARVLRSADLGSAASGATVGELAARYAREAPPTAAGGCTASRRRRFAHEAFAWAFGAEGPPRRALAVMRQGHVAGARSARATGAGQGVGLPQQAGRVELRPLAGPLQKNVFGGLFAD